MTNLTAEIQLANFSSRVESIISTLNSIAISGKSLMVVTECASICDNQVSGRIQLSVGADLEFKFTVIAPSMAYIGNFASRFNMACAHYCNVKFELSDSSTLTVNFIPPNDEICERIQKFFKLTSISAT